MNKNNYMRNLKTFYTQDEFISWIDEQSKKYTIVDKSTPDNYPCVVVSHVFDNDYLGIPDSLDFVFVYKTDLKID